MASAELLKLTHSVDGKVMGVDDRVKGVDDRVKGVEGKVQDVGDDVQVVRDDVQDVRDNIQGIRGDMQDVRCDMQNVCGDVQDVRGDVQNVGNRVQGVDDRVQRIGIDVKGNLDEVNRSLSLYLLVVLNAHTASQGTSSEMVFHDGYRPQIRLPIIIMLARLITTVQLNGFFKAVYSTNGNPPDLSYGSTENVRYS